MKRFVLVLLCAVGCGDVGEDVVVESDILITITPVAPSPGPAAHCELQEDKTTCHCWGECTPEGITAVVRECNRLRDLAKIVIP
jgi:hypothetical protein